MPRVTVAIPSYNHEKYIAQAIQSVLDQTYQDFEIIITDDGSSDHTVNVIKTFSDPRIRLFCFAKNQGTSSAMNHCIREGRGEYMAILNSDDIFFPDKLEKQVKFLDEHNEIGAVFGSPQIIDDDGNDFLDIKNIQKKNRSRFEWLNYFFWHGNALYHPSVLIRRVCYEKIGEYDEQLAQTPDFDFWMRLCMKYDIHILQENLIKYRIRSCSANASADKPETRKRILFEQLYILRNYLTISTEQDFLSIFPEALEYSEEFEVALIPFYLALLTIKKNTSPYLLFAFQNLFRLFENKEIRERIYEKYNFSIADLIKLTGEYDVFNIELERIKNNEIQDIIVEKDDTITRLINSTSWKITVPIRLLVNFFKKFFMKITWNKSITSELIFWEQWMCTSGLQWKEGFQDRIDPHSSLQSPLCDYVPLCGKNAKILDVGAGPLTFINKNLPEYPFQIFPVDALARYYDVLLRKYGIEPLVRTEYCHGEFLYKKFEANYFDIVYSRNALDHTYDPLRCIKNMILVTKKNGFVVIEVFENEGTVENWTGLHQWNFYTKNIFEKTTLFIEDKNGKTLDVIKEFYPIIKNVSMKKYERAITFSFQKK